jgi:hypothetical protein
MELHDRSRLAGKQLPVQRELVEHGTQDRFPRAGEIHHRVIAARGREHDPHVLRVAMQTHGSGSQASGAPYCLSAAFNPQSQASASVTRAQVG